MDGYVTIGTKLDTKSFDAQIIELENKLGTLEKIADESNIPEKFRRSAEETKKLNAEIERTKNQIVELKRKQNDLNNKGISSISESLNDIGKAMGEIIKKASIWALAILGIRSIYLGIRSAVNILSQYDEQLATDIEYIRWALATALKPIIEWIMGAIKTIISLVGSLIHAIFGVNIFANSTADAFMKAKDNLKSSNKEAKKLQKTLAGFDEMNVLQENGNVSAGGGGGGIPTPSFDASELMKIPNLNKITDFWKDIFNFWEKDWKNVFNNLGGKWGSFLSGLVLTGKGFYDIIKGIIESIIGVVQVVLGTIWGLLTGNWDLVKQGFNNLIKGIKDIIIGVIEFISGILLTILGAVKGAILEIWNFLYNVLIKPIISVFSTLLNILLAPIKGFISFMGNVWNKVSDAVDTLKKEFKKAFKKIGEYFMKPINDFINGIKGLWNKIKKPLEDVGKKIGDNLNPSKIASNIGKGIGNIGKSIGNLFGFAKGGIVVPKLASGGIINQPGRGVPLASAIGGEAGAEGVIPLTDSQQMALLGEAIGRYITVNLTNVTELDGRQIARKVEQISQNNRFVLNR